MTAVGGPRAHAAARAQVHAAFREAVRDGLARSGLRQKDLATAVGKSAVDISRYLSDPQRLPRNWKLVEQILVAASTDVEEFRRNHGGYWSDHTAESHENKATVPTSSDEPPDLPYLPSGTATGEAVEPADARDVSLPSTLEPLEARPNGLENLADSSRIDIAIRDRIDEDRSPGHVGDPSKFDPTERDSKRLAANSRIVTFVAIFLSVIIAGVTLVLVIESYSQPSQLAQIPTNTPTSAIPAPPTSTTPIERAATVSIYGARRHGTPSKDPATIVGEQLAPGTTVRTVCGVVGDAVTGTDLKQSTTWLRQSDGRYLSATVLEMTGSPTITNCVPGGAQLPVRPSTP